VGGIGIGLGGNELSFEWIEVLFYTFPPELIIRRFYVLTDFSL